MVSRAATVKTKGSYHAEVKIELARRWSQNLLAFCFFELAFACVLLIHKGLWKGVLAMQALFMKY